MCVFVDVCARACVCFMSFYFFSGAGVQFGKFNNVLWGGSCRSQSTPKSSPEFKSLVAFGAWRVYFLRLDCFCLWLLLNGTSWFEGGSEM